MQSDLRFSRFPKNTEYLAPEARISPPAEYKL